MKVKKITITEDALLKAYKNGDENVKNAFERLYGIEMFHPKSIMDRIKTFDDAVDELGGDHPLVMEYQKITDNVIPETLAFLKLRIITAALNEGWKPKFKDNEKRYYPYFFFYTKEEYKKMDEDERYDIILLNESNNDVYAGFASTSSYSVPSYAHMSVGSRLSFKTRELADYAGEQFIELYADLYKSV